MSSQTETKTYTVGDLTEGPVARALFAFSLPFMLSTILQQVYSMTDTIIVGQFLGSSGLSAVSNGSQIMAMLYSIVIGFCNGGQVLIAQAKGAGNYKKLQKLVESLCILTVLISLILLVISTFFAHPILDLMKTPAEAYDQAAWYMIICGIGVLFTGLYNLFSAVLRGLGDSRHPFLFVLIATVLNVFLDIFFIAVLHLNVAGAALATVIGQAVSVLFSIWFLVTHAEQFGLRFDFLRFRPEADASGMILRLGLPMAIQYSAVQISFLFVARMINALGVVISAAFGVMQKIRSLLSFITQGFALGAASMMGQNLGAGKLDRVDKVVRSCLLFTLAVDLAAAVLYLFFPELCFRIFTQEKEVLSYAVMTMLVLAIELPANVFMPACNSLISAQGFVKLSFTVGILDAVVGRIFFCWFLGSFCGLGAFGYFLGYVIGTYVTAVVAAFYYFSGLWKKRAALVS